MINIIKKELFVYTGLLTMLMLIMHPDLLSNPTERLANMQVMGNYVHPLLYTFFIYLVLYFFRTVFSFIKRLFSKKED